MLLTCKAHPTPEFTSMSQKIRFLTECWFSEFGYCLRCSSNQLARTLPNTPARDYICPICESPYELKSGKGRLQSKVVDGAYSALIARVNEGSAPNLILLRYAQGLEVESIVAVHSVFLTPLIVEKRKPLSATARRAGWVGCNLRLDLIPADGQIKLVEDGVQTDKEKVRALYIQAERFRDIPAATRGWTALVLAAVRRLQKSEFVLADLYAQKQVMQAVYPGNTHIEEKIRQQLQKLRDLGYIKFMTRKGTYQLIL